MATPDVHRAVEAIWRIEAPRLIAGLARVVRDVGVAEDFAQDALVAALESWPSAGVPEHPYAWLKATVRNRAIDLYRRNTRLADREASLAHDLRSHLAWEGADVAATLDDAVGDDVLALMFTCCHPVLPREARVALTLRLLGGLSTAEIAHAFLAPEKTLGQRISRAKRTLAETRVPFAVPSGDALAPRLASVLEVVYLVFNEGYTATSGERWMRRELYEEAMRLGRVLAALAPEEPEVHGLAALMEIQASRAPARVGADGEAVLLLDQDRSRWDRTLVVHGLASLRRAEQLGGLVGPYRLQAAIAAHHARARTAAETPWPRIVALYDALAQLAPSPIIELNRAVAVGMAFGPQAGLELIEALIATGTLDGYHWLPSVHGDLLARLGRKAEARSEFARAASLTANARERELLLARSGT